MNKSVKSALAKLRNAFVECEMMGAEIQLTVNAIVNHQPRPFASFRESIVHPVKGRSPGL